MSKKNNFLHDQSLINTNCVHAGVKPDEDTGAVLTPIFQSTTFIQESIENYLSKGFSYSRQANPTVSALENKISILENGYGTTCVSSGMAATTTVVTGLMNSGDHCIIIDSSYGGTNRICRKQFIPLGMEFDFVDFRDLDLIRNAIKSNTKIIFNEMPSNPLLRLSDLEQISKIAHENNLYHVCDSTFATPIILKPLNYGVDVVIQSTTKYYDGHNMTIGGAIISKTKELNDRMHFVSNMHGNIMTPHNAFLTLQTCKTLNLRVEKQSNNALKLAQWLEQNSKIEKVIYPGLDSFPQLDLVKKYFKNNLYGGMLWFDVKGGDKAAIKLMNNIKRPWSLCENLGATESIITACAVMTHANMLPEDRAKVGITDGFIRVSCGIEDVEDLIFALEEALSVN